MKQCSRCNSLYAPRLDVCPFCEGQKSGTPPEAWIRVRSQKTPRQIAVIDESPTREMEPTSGDVTVEFDADFLEENSAAIVQAIEDAIAERAEPQSSKVHFFEDDVPTAKVKYLGAHDPDEYDIENLVDPPTPEAVAAILAEGREEPESMLRRAFAELDAELDEESVPGLQAPSTETFADTVEHAEALVRHARELSQLRKASEIDSPLPGRRTEISPPRVGESQTVEVDESAGSREVEERAANSLLSEDESPDRGDGRQWTGLFASLGLAVCTAWAVTVGLPMIAVLALAVGSVSLLVLTRR